MRVIKKPKTVAMVFYFFMVAILFTGCTIAGDQPAGTSGARRESGKSKNMTASNNAEQPGPNEVQIVIENFVFVPSEITIPAGTKVSWINKDEAPHTATS